MRCSLKPGAACRDADSVVWTREFGQERFNSVYDRMKTCAMLRTTLNSVGARHLVVGHNPAGAVHCQHPHLRKLLAN